MRIAMWSGPRNLSTAMMYSFAARPDFAVVDEPFYAAYLQKTGISHPLRNEILGSQSNDPDQVSQELLGSIPGNKTHYYQKHMTQHMISDMPRDWIKQVKNVFLIRDPARVISSYSIKRENPSLDDIGFWQQAEIFDKVQAAGGNAVVIDSHDIRDDPEGMLRKLCHAIDLEFDPAMLGWPKGGNSSDGVWASYWYGAVWKSTGFAGAEGPLPKVPEHLRQVEQLARDHYERLKEFKL